ncbi:MAG: PEP-CTERM sorting domain-containing protein [Planctomycetota bacterium]
MFSKLLRSLVAIAAIALIGTSKTPKASAGVIPPDIQVSLTYLVYNNADATFDPPGFPASHVPDAQQLRAGGFAVADRFVTSAGNLTLDLGSDGPGPATFEMTADIDESGDLLGGSFEIFGDDPFDDAVSGDTSVSLLSGSFTDVRGALETAGVLEFEADSIGGAFANLFGSEVVIKIGGLSTGNSFLHDFFVAGFGSANVGRPVPEPSTFAVWCIGAGALLVRRRRN